MTNEDNFKAPTPFSPVASPAASLVMQTNNTNSANPSNLPEPSCQPDPSLDPLTQLSHSDPTLKPSDAIESSEDHSIHSEVTSIPQNSSENSTNSLRPSELSQPSPDASESSDTQISSSEPSLDPSIVSPILPSGVPYSVPNWSGACQDNYSLEVLKNGTIISTIDLSVRPTHVIGRLPACHLVLEHPSLSRFHAVLQYRAVPEPKRGIGWYIFDLESTHGTLVNKIKVRPMEFHRIRVGHVIKFGGSTRLYVVQGPEEDKETESDVSYSQYLAFREKQNAELEAKRLAVESAKMEKQSNRDGACSWGFGEDAVEDEVEEVFEMADEPKHEEHYIKDPKKFLRSYFEREGFDQPEYEFLDAGFGKHHCRVELLPLQSTGTGRTTFAEAVISGGKKKEAVAACALEACRMLDRMGELFKAATNRAQRRMRDWEANEYYDSDEDTFLDRTGDIERKRAKRMAQAGKSTETERNGKATSQKADTFESLTKEFSELGEQIREIEATLERSRKQLQGGDAPAATELDALDAYMQGIKAGALDRRSRMTLKIRLTEMRRQSESLRKRLQAAAPNLSILSMRAGAMAKRAYNPSAENVSVSDDGKMVEESIKQTETNVDSQQKDLSKGSNKNASQPLTGSMRFSIRSTARRPLSKSALSAAAPSSREDNVVEEEEEEEDEDEDENEANKKTLEPSNTSEKSNSNRVLENEASSTTGITSPAPKEVEPERNSNPVMLPARPPLPESMEVDAPKEENTKRRKRPRQASSCVKQDKEEDFPEDPDYVCWMPPENQSGDGKTILNSRFGY